MDDFCIPVTLMSGGRVTTPQEIRDALKVKDGDQIEIKIPKQKKEDALADTRA
jgi:bifunctional DNA-binding transcriptional regulator/antitoxin component of YhaV-PrlF toxin-antitoxin module